MRARVAILVTVLVLLGGMATTHAGRAQTATPSPTVPGLIAGNVLESLPEGTPGELSVIAYGVIDSHGGRAVVVIRNRTGQTVYEPTVSATAKTPDGKLYAVSDPQSVSPGRIDDGGVAFTDVWFRDVELTDEITIEFTINDDPDGKLSFERRPNMTILSADVIAARVVGEAINDQAIPLQFILARGICFVDGNPYDFSTHMLTDQSVESGETLAFQINFIRACDGFLVTIG